ncbi:MAG: DGC domain protein [Methanoregula sp. PtaU1.Bin006]|uniref:putative zinc-binding protein n=1 Tax=Methanoregula sp. PtaU1.Bin006 TaxID=1811681 RepID=UPI0009CC60D3|nr:putative zinc-binding protein [Methanoregula sp. PtaU1.Bin006]OPY32868.1 MAG: DGC domain protein [Methanoregula sp. PtaU1.Bin006]
MTEKTTCSCGADGPERIIFPCAGQANVGQLTNLAALQLREEGYGSVACIALLATGAESLVANALKADEVVILDGCPMLCAKKIAGAQGIAAGQYLVLTEMGIAKGPSKDYTQDDIEKVVSACWKGEGRVKKDAPPGKKSRGKDSGCGCGCGGSC